MRVISEPYERCGSYKGFGMQVMRDVMVFEFRDKGELNGKRKRKLHETGVM